MKHHFTLLLNDPSFAVCCIHLTIHPLGFYHHPWLIGNSMDGRKCFSVCPIHLIASFSPLAPAIVRTLTSYYILTFLPLSTPQLYLGKTITNQIPRSRRSGLLVSTANETKGLQPRPPEHYQQFWVPPRFWAGPK